MKERPILFSAPMVKAILGGIKSQTRRVIKAQPTGWTPECESDGLTWAWCVNGDQDYSERIRCPYGQPGDRLWVKETWRPRVVDDVRLMYAPVDAYRADMQEPWTPDGKRWQSPRFMPRWASRITLEITDVRVERVQSISHNDALAEGVSDADQGGDLINGSYAITNFARLWDSINEKRGYSWEINPWVWALTFKRVA